MTVLVPLHALDLPMMQDIEQAIRDLGQPEPQHDVEHIFHAGLYARRFTMPAGILAVGRIHRFESLSILTKGACTVWTSEEVLHITAPHTIRTRALTKRVVYSHTDIELMDIYATNFTDPELIESVFVVPPDEVLP